jgi:hypothetical protein
MYVPADNPFAVEVETPFGDHVYVKDAPPEAITVADPSASPLQVTFV